MYAEAKRYREERKAKAQRLASADPHEHVDSSSWTPPESINPGKQTGLKPVSKQHLRRGGKVHHVEGEHEHKRADRKPRASGGRSVANAIATVNEKAANKEEFGSEHIGALRHGGRARAHRLYGGPLAPSLAAGYPGGGGDVPASRMGFQAGPSEMSKAIGIKSGGRAKRAKGGRAGKFLGGGMGGMGMPGLGMASPMGAGGGQMGAGQTPQVMPNMPQTQFPTNGSGMSGVGGVLNQVGSSMPAMTGMQNQFQAENQQMQNALSGMQPQPQSMSPQMTQMMQPHPFGDPEGRMGQGGQQILARHPMMGRAKGGKVKGHVEHHHPDCQCLKCNPVYGGTRPTGGRIAKKDGGKADHWIAGATKNKGALHRKLGVPEGEKIPAKKLAKAEHSKSPTERKEANLAETLKGMNREHHAKGGKTKGKMAVNIIIAPGGARGPNPMMDPQAGQQPHPAQPIPMPQPPMMPPGGMPYPMPMPMGGAPMPMGMGAPGGMPPPGMPPGMPRKRGGRAYAGPTDERGGAGGGEGRLKKRKAYGNEARGAGPNQVV
jgi:hypothetical protein